MRVPFRQGIVQYNHPAFVQVRFPYVDLVANSSSPLIFNIASGQSNYLHVEKRDISNAWGQITYNTDVWLYVDIDRRTAQRTFGTTYIEPTVGATSPASPANNQHWFDTTTNQMKVWNGTTWLVKIRIFACKLQNGSIPISMSINSPDFSGTQIGNTTPVFAGYILSDLSSNPIKSIDGQFTHSEDVIKVNSLSASDVKVSSLVIEAMADVNIPAYTIVEFTHFGKISPANAFVTQVKKQYGITQHDAVTGDILNVYVDGLITNLLWDWTSVGVNAYIYNDNNGMLVTTPVIPGQQPVAIVVDIHTIMLITKTIINSIPPEFSDTDTAGIVKLTVPPYIPSSPVAVGDNDPRMSDARTPTVHNHTIADITDINTKLNVAGGTMTGALVLHADPIIDLGAATKHYVDNVRLDNIFDVNVSAATNGQFLMFNGTNWVGASSSSVLSGLSDVTLTSPTSGQILTFNGTVWINSTVIPSLTSNSGKFLTNNGTVTSWAAVDALPSQTSNSGKFLTTNGTVASWATVDALPLQTSNSGKFLTTNGTIASWATVDALPSQTSNSGKFLTTNGTVASWSTLSTTLDGLSDVVISTPTLNQILKYDGNNWVNSATSGLPDQTDLSGRLLTTNGTTASWTNTVNIDPNSRITGIVSAILGAGTLTSSTVPTSGTNDDGYWTITLPFAVRYQDVDYLSAFVGTNSYLTFDTGSSVYQSIGAGNPAAPKILLNSGDRSCQRVYYGIEGTAPTRQFRIRYEGHTSYSGGVLGSPTLVWEVTFFEDTPSKIEVQFGALGDVAGLGGFYSATTLDQPFTVAATTGYRYGKYNAIAFTGALAIANGGTGQTTASAAINALLPTQTSNIGKVLTTDGTVSRWGNMSEVLYSYGDGTRVLTVENGILTFAPLSNIISNKQQLWGMGSNTNGQLGDGTIVQKSSPVQIGALTDWTEISCGTDFTAAIKSNGSLWTWGSNGSGQLADGTISKKSSPIQIGSLTNWASIDCGDTHAFAVKYDGTLWGWGSGLFGALGNNSSNSASSPLQIGTDKNWRQVSAGSSDTIAVKQDGSLWSWGLNNHGQLGLGTSNDTYVPTQVGNLTNWKQISVRASNVAAIKQDGSLWTWGHNDNGQLGQGTTVTHTSSPAQVGSLTDWKYVSCGYNFTAALKTNGTLWIWGNNFYGQLGQGFSAGPNISSPIQVGSLADWKQISSGKLHILAIKTDGSLWGWGYNDAGDLGIGNAVRQSSPVQIGALTNWSQVFAGAGDHNFALTPAAADTLPSQTSNSGKFLTTNGTTASWATVNASPGGSTTQLQYNSAGNFAGASGITTDGTNLTLTGNLSFGSTGSRILGDFTNATRANRTIFQTTAANTFTTISNMPSGSGTQATYVAYAGSDPDNAAYITLTASTTGNSINSYKNGTGITQPLALMVENTTHLNIPTGVVAVNYLDVIGSVSTSPVILRAAGADTNISINLIPKGSGSVVINGNAMWHAGNDGAASGLDADLLDGQHGAYYLDNTNATGTLAITNGGTGQTSASTAINALLPTQGGNAGNVLTTNGSVASWSPFSGRVSNVSYNASTSLTWSNVDIVRITLTGNITITNTGAYDGQRCVLELTQDGVGNRTIAFTSETVLGGDIVYLPSTAPNKTDVIGLIYHQPTAKYRIVAVARGY